MNVASTITNCLCQHSKGNQLHVVDIGGGKGYLSSLLAMEYKLKVLGVDSNCVNTHGAALRSLKLQVSLYDVIYIRYNFIQNYIIYYIFVFI